MARDLRDDEEVRRQLGATIRRLRQARGLTLRELAHECDVSFAMLNHIELRGQNTTLASLQRILRALDARILVEEPQTPVAAAVSMRLATVLAFVPEEEREVFEHQLALWERRYLPKDR